MNDDDDHGVRLTSRNNGRRDNRVHGWGHRWVDGRGLLMLLFPQWLFGKTEDGRWGKIEASPMAWRDSSMATRKDWILVEGWERENESSATIGVADFLVRCSASVRSELVCSTAKKEKNKPMTIQLRQQNSVLHSDRALEENEQLDKQQCHLERTVYWLQWTPPPLLLEEFDRILNLDHEKRLKIQ